MLPMLKQETPVLHSGPSGSDSFDGGVPQWQGVEHPSELGLNCPWTHIQVPACKCQVSTAQSAQHAQSQKVCVALTQNWDLHNCISV